MNNIFGPNYINIMFMICYSMGNISKSSKFENGKGVPQKVIPEI